MGVLPGRAHGLRLHRTRRPAGPQPRRAGHRAGHDCRPVARLAGTGPCAARPGHRRRAGHHPRDTADPGRHHPGNSALAAGRAPQAAAGTLGHELSPFSLHSPRRVAPCAPRHTAAGARQPADRTQRPCRNWSYPMAAKSVLDQVISLSKRRGFVFQAGEIYGGSRSAWDYGPLGAELKENIKRQWWQSMVRGREDVVGLDSSVILPRQVWEASGHVEVFSDPLVECLSCHKRYRADHLEEEYEEKKGRPAENGLKDIACANCGTRGEWTEPQEFSGLLKTFLGPVASEEGLHYLRPETAQGIFVNFNNVLTTSRKKPPFGIGQIGKSFRNEITPGNFIFRTREFEQMEMEFFVEPGTDEEWHQYWMKERMSWYTDLGIREENLPFFGHPLEKLSHYSKGTTDTEYRFGFQGSEWGEL